MELEHFERDIFSLRQELTSASGGGNRHNNGSASGGSNRHTAGLESELRQIQDRAGQLQRSRAELVRNIHYLRGTYMETLFIGGSNSFTLNPLHFCICCTVQL